MSIRPEDILSDQQNTTEVKGVVIRKGTVAAAIANAKILASNAFSVEEKAAAKNTIKELVPAMIALDLHEHLQWRNPEIQQLFDAYLRTNQFQK